MKRWWMGFMLNAITVLNSNAQISILGPGTIYQNFDALGTTTSASLPASWKFSEPGAGNPSSLTYNAAGNFTVTNVQASSGSPATGGRYNWGNGADISDRAIGFITTGSYSTPNAIMTSCKNESGVMLNGVKITFDLERYRINTATFTLGFYYSLNGSNWTIVGDGSIASSVFPTGSNAYTFIGGASVSRTVEISGLNVIDGQVLYLMWTFVNSASANSQGIGLDNISITPNLSASSLPVRFSNFAARKTPVGVELRWSNLSESEVGDYFIEHSNDGSRFTTVSNIQPHSNTGGKADYSFTDVNHESDGYHHSISFYRIRAVEKGGTDVFSNILRIDGHQQTELFWVAPNPVSGSLLFLGHSRLKPGLYIIEIHDINGRRLVTRALNHPGGYFIEEISLTQMPTGAYYLSVSGSQSFKTKFLRQ